jgi:hypothetical protein
MRFAANALGEKVVKRIERSHAAIAVCIIACVLSVMTWKQGAAESAAVAFSTPAVLITAAPLRGQYDLSQAASNADATWLSVGNSGGLALNTGVDRKADGYRLEPPAAVGSLKPAPGNVNPFVAGMGEGNDFVLSWHDGAPDASNGERAWEWGVAGINNGFVVTLPGTETNAAVNTATVFTAAYCAQMRMKVHASDGSFADQTDAEAFIDTNIGTGTNYAYNVQYRTSSPGAAITLEFTNANASECKGQKGVISFRGEILRRGVGQSLPAPTAPVAAAFTGKAIDFVQPAVKPHGTLALSEVPAQADKFVDSIGVMTFFGLAYRAPSKYYENLVTVQNLLKSSGIRHIRDYAPPRGYAGYNNVPTTLGPLQAAGIKMDFQTQLPYTKSQLLDAQTHTQEMIDEYEAPNEPNDQGNPDWINQTAGYQVDLAAWIKNNPPTANVGIIGPSITEATGYPNQSCCMDYGNSHGYQGSHHPENAGYGSQTAYGVYGSTSYNINKSLLPSYPKPIVYTECGYGSVPTGQSISKDVIDYYAALRYTPRLYFWHFYQGIPRTYQGELLDSAPPTSTRLFGQYGLIDDSIHIKPAYTAMSGIIALLSDKGPAFTPKPLSYTLRGSMENVYHELLAKRDGTYWLALWLGVRSWDADCNKSGHPTCSAGDIVVSGQKVILESTSTYRSASAFTSDERGKYTAAPVSGWTGTSGTITVTDKISMIRLMK